MENQNATLEELAPLISGEQGLIVYETGELDQGVMACGQVVGLVHHIPTVKQLIEEIIHEAEEVMSRFNIEDIFQPLRKPS